MAGNSQRRGAVRKTGKGNTAGSGGRRRRGLEGKGPTPKAEDRVYHPAHQRQRAGALKASRPRRERPDQAEWVAGRNPSVEALRADVPVQTLYVSEGAEHDDRLREILLIAAERSLPTVQVGRAELDRLLPDSVHQGVALRLRGYEYAHPDDLLARAWEFGAAPVVVALDQVLDPRNLGAIVRSSAAFGAAGVIIGQRRSAQVTAATWKSSAGAAARIPIARATNLTRTLLAYQEAGFQVVGLAGGAHLSLADIANDTPVVLVVGSEGAGLSRLVRSTCDLVAGIPIASEVESLNASVAASIALYELARRPGGGTLSQ